HSPEGPGGPPPTAVSAPPERLAAGCAGARAANFIANSRVHAETERLSRPAAPGPLPAPPAAAPGPPPDHTYASLHDPQDPARPDPGRRLRRLRRDRDPRRPRPARPC